MELVTTQPSATFGYKVNIPIKLNIMNLFSDSGKSIIFDEITTFLGLITDMSTYLCVGVCMYVCMCVCMYFFSMFVSGNLYPYVN